MHGWSQLILVVHQGVKLIKHDPLVCILIQSAHDSDHIGLTGIVIVSPAEIHNVAKVKEALCPIVNRLECAHVRPIEAPS